MPSHPPPGPRPQTAGPPSGPASPFPIRLQGTVISGFGRGSKDLGIPTANIPIEGLSVGGHDELDSGVYFGFAALQTYVEGSGGSSHKLPEVGKKDGGQVDGGREEGKGGEKVDEVQGGGGKDGDEGRTEAQEEGQEKHAGVFPMVMSIGWNPYYKNEKRSVEVHIMHSFAKDFYGTQMKVLILGFIRPEYDYTSLESLVEDIRTDIDVAQRSVQREGYERFRGEGWLVEF